MNAVLIIPTGVGAAIGGHAGDANPVAKLLAGLCDRLLLHPNVVNASDINEMPENSLYIDGAMLDRFLEGRTQLREVLYNKILVVANKPVTPDTYNAVAAARHTLGVPIEIVPLETPLRMIATISPTQASGTVYGHKELIRQVSGLTFDALAIHTSIEVDRDITLRYYREGGINPWGGVEALASRLIATSILRPIAHAPLENALPADDELYNIDREQVSYDRIAAEIISNCYLHSVLKGLSRAPVCGQGLHVSDIDFLISPDMPFGRPHEAALNAGIEIIVVRENSTAIGSVSGSWEGRVTVVENYLEAAGVLAAARAGVTPESVRV
jgi:hypothetical protein